MKKLCCLLLALSTVFAITACAPKEDVTPQLPEEEVTQTKPEPVPVPEKEPAEAVHPRVSISFSTEDSSFVGQGDGSDFFSALTNASVSIAQYRDAENAINQFLQKEIEDITKQAQDMHKTATAQWDEADEEEKAILAPQGLYRTMDVKRLDQYILSIRVDDSVNTGGAHPNNTVSGWNFDVMTGEIIELSQICDDPQVLEDFMQDYLATKMITTESEDTSEEALETPLETPLKTEPEAELEPLLTEDNWYFSQDEFVVVMGDRHATGIVEMGVPYEQLDSILYTHYMQAESVPATEESGLMVGYSSDTTQEAEDYVAIDIEGVEVQLTANGTLRDIRIYEVLNGTPEYSKIHYATNYLDDGDAVELLVTLPCGMAKTMVTWLDENNRTQQRFLADSGKDGSVLLTEVN